MDKKELVADIRLLLDENGAFHVESQILNDDEVAPQDLVRMMGLGVWDTLKKSLWPDASKRAKDMGVTDDRWDEFEEKMDYLVQLEVEQFMLAVVSAGTAPFGFTKDNGLLEFEELFKFVDEFVSRHQTDSEKE